MAGAADSALPTWAHVLGSTEALRAFVDAITRDLLGRGYPGTIVEDGVVRMVGAGGHATEFGIGNLVQHCASLAPAEYAWAITRYFDTVFELKEREAAFAAEAQDFDRVKRLLRVKLFGGDYVEQFGSALIHRREADDLYAALAFDLPTAVRSVEPDLLAKWGLLAEDVFEIALANVRAEGRLEKSAQRGVLGTLLVLRGPSHFAASHALFLDDYFDEAPRNGALVAVPNRHEIRVVPITSASSVRAAARLAEMAADSYEKGPGSISTSVFWRRADGSFERIRGEGPGGAVQLAGSEGFRDMMRRLAAS